MDAGLLSPTARQVIAAVERLQTDRARLRSLLAEVADTAIDAGPDAGAIVALPPGFLAEIRAALAACPDDFATLTQPACCAQCGAPMLPDTHCGPCRWDALPEGPAL